LPFIYRENELLFGMAKKKERLIAVSPSGKKEGSLADLIHDVVRQIPCGRVTSYGAIAAVLDLPNPRMVGRAMRTADDKVNPIPFQRVINSSGRLTGEYRDWRKKLLEKEGVTIKGDKIVDFKTLFWDPAKEL
jgi:methylated-DNA-protein-cysteine methyltransferase-like protein